MKLPDGTDYKMVPFKAGNNADYVTGIIAMHHLLAQKESEDDESKAFEVVKDVTDWLWPLTTALKSNTSKLEKEEMKVQLTTVKEELQKAKKEALTGIWNAYKLIFNYFVGNA